VIELDRIAKTYGTFAALKGISFSVPTGSICALLGHNGAGKTTTVKILSTLVRPTSGTAVVAGHDVMLEPGRVRANIGVTGQDAALDGSLTGRENLVLFCRLRGMGRRAARRRADELVEQFELAYAADRAVATYSGGMRRRIDIAVSLVVPPKVLFLDEPTTGLDPRSRRDVWNLVSSLKEQNTTVLLTTQYLEEADVLSDSIVIVDSGQVIAQGTANELKSGMRRTYCHISPSDPDDLDRVAEALTGFANIEIDRDTDSVAIPALEGAATLSEVLNRMTTQGIELADIGLRKPTLDEVFLHLTERESVL